MNYKRKSESRHEVKDIIRIVNGIEIGIFFLFFLFGIFTEKYSAIAGILHGISTIAVFYAGFKQIEKRINGTMKKVNDTVQALIEGNKTEKFSVCEDNLLSKFQVQILKMHTILNAYREREQNLREQVSELTGDMVHQINTPITNIILYCGLLERDNQALEMRHTFITHIAKQAEKLKWFGENFAKISRLEAGIMQLRPEQQAFLPILLNAIDQVSSGAELKQIEIILDGNGLESNAYFDYKWTEEAIYNVLDNAVKYGDDHSQITVNVTNQDLYLHITITNQGIEIPKEEYTQIFKRFYRGTNASRQEGVGLGLYLARKILTEEKGYIKVSSNRHLTVFTILLKENK